MKKLLFLSLFLCGFSGFSQHMRYGALIGMNAYDIEVSGPFIAGSGISGLNVGGFIDYQFKNNLGLKLNMIFNQTKETDYGPLVGGTFTTAFDEIKLTTLQFQPLLKIDVNKVYAKGFYLQGGFSLVNVLSAKADDGASAKPFYKGSSISGMFGFGVTFLKHYSFELMGSYSLTNPLDSNESKAKNMGAYGNLLIDIESFLHK
jgi:outer membrane protein with beta-barrel domain